MKNPLTPYAQRLRREQTKEERKLWYEFLKTYPVRFHRQYVLDPYTVDFYCHKAKLVVELDGSQHYEHSGQERDAKRTADLNEMGLAVLRFSNLDVLHRYPGVCEAIDLAVKKAVSSQGKSESPLLGEGAP